MATGIIGPASFGSRDVDGAYRLELSQKVQFPGKRFWRGQNALAEAAAAQGDVDAMRLELTELARGAFLEYALARRLLTVNAESARLLKDFKENAQTRYQTGVGTEQDVLQADVELGRQRERLLELEQMAKVASARINTLTRRNVEAPLPPPANLGATSPLVRSVAELRQQALEYRPDLQAVAQRVQADEANLIVALKERYPDVEVMAAYDAFWQPSERDLRPMLGLRMNLPVVAGRRHGMIQEAQAKIAQRRAEYTKLADQVQFQVQEAHAQVERGRKTVKLYEDNILKAAQANIKAAQAAYVTGKIPFLSLIEAQRNLIMLRERYYESITNLHRAEAALDRAVGVDFNKD
jgi:outer membrane protein TolC